ncbi:MAG: DUF429 domain-containing protein [Acidimicrobiia bacterium]
MRVVGGDVWRKGWVAVGLADGRLDEVATFDSVGELIAAHPEAVVIALDMPIGLPEQPPRPADVEARSFLGPRRSSVFPAPPKDVLERKTYREARLLSKKRYGQGLSAYSYSMRRRIMETDEASRHDRRLIEVHPEVSFRALAGTPLEYSKRTWNGQMERRALLEQAGIVLPDRLPAGVGQVPVDDVLDAAAAAWSARRHAMGEALSLPTSSPPGTGGVIWY